MFKQCLLGLIVLEFIASSTHAAPGAQWDVDTANTIPNVIANRLTADGEGIDWTVSQLRVDLSQGLVHNGAPDSAGPQDGFWGFFPELEWDTYVGIPGGTNDVWVPFNCGLGCGPISLAGQLVNMPRWGGTATTETGPTQIANISLTNDSAGTWSMQTAFAGGLVVESSGVVINGAIVPEPASMGLLGLGVMGLSQRRRVKR